MRFSVNVERISLKRTGESRRADRQQPTRRGSISVGVTSQTVYRVDFAWKFRPPLKLIPQAFPHYPWAVLACLGTQQDRIRPVPKYFLQTAMRFGACRRHQRRGYAICRLTGGGGRDTGLGFELVWLVRILAWSVRADFNRPIWHRYSQMADAGRGPAQRSKHLL